MRFSIGSSYRSAMAWSALRTAASRAAAPGFFAGHSRDCGGPSLGMCIGGRALSGNRATTSSASSQLASARLAWRRENAGISRNVARSGCLCAANSVIASRAGSCSAPGPAVGRRVAGEPELRDVRETATAVDMMDARGATPWITSRLGAHPSACHERGKFLLCPRPFAGLDQLLAQAVTQLDQQFDVQGGIDKPFLRQWPARPVRCGVLLEQPNSQSVPRPSCPAPPWGNRAAAPPTRCRTAWSEQARLRADTASPGWRHG